MSTIQERVKVSTTQIIEIPSIVPDLGKGDFAQKLLDVMKVSFRKRFKRQPRDISDINDEQAIIMVIKDFNKDLNTELKSGYVGGSKIRYISNKFLLQTLQENQNEKVQIMETFGEPHISFFGERAKIYQGVGIALEADNIKALSDTEFSENFGLEMKYRWASALQDFYQEHLRGTKLIENNNIAVLFVASYILYGYFLNFIMNRSAGDNNLVTFSFSFLVREQRNIYKDELDILYDIYKQVVSVGELSKWKVAYERLNEVNQNIEKYTEQLTSPAFDLSTPEAERIQRLLDIEKSNRDNVITELTKLVKDFINKDLED